MHQRLLLASFAVLLLWPSGSAGQSARRAFWYSLLIPGWGQYYGGRPTSGARYLVAELAIWSGYLGLQRLGDVRAEHYRTYAAAHAGARPAERCPVDARVVDQVTSGTGGIIKSQEDVGGWPALAENCRELTVPNNPSGDDDGDGYTNLEEWLHAFAAEVERR